MTKDRRKLRYEFEPTGKPDIAGGKGAPGRAQLYYHAPFRFTGTIHNVTMDVSGELIKDEAAEMHILMARQ